MQCLNRVATVFCASKWVLLSGSYLDPPKRNISKLSNWANFSLEITLLLYPFFEFLIVA